jgi:hypothetical protein
MTKLWGGCGKITRQLGNIENNTRFFRKKFMFQLLISRYGSRLRDFWYESQKKAKKTTRDKGLQGWNDVAVWRDFKPIYIPEDIWLHYLEHVTSERFIRCSQSGAGNRNRPIHGSVTMHTGGSVPFAAQVKWMVRLISKKYIVRLICC